MKYLVTHSHPYGDTNYFVETNKKLVGVSMGEELSEEDKALIQALEINFDPHKQESISVEEVTGFVNLDGDQEEKPWEEYDEFKERANEMVARLNFDTPTEDEMKEAYEIYLVQPEEDPSGDIVLWTEFAISNVVGQKAKDNEVIDGKGDPQEQALEEQRNFYQSVIHPKLIDMAIDCSLPMDMTELHFYYFEERAKRWNAPKSQREVITYKGEDYPVRKFFVQIPDEDEPREITLSTQDLSIAMDGKYDIIGTEEEDIDCRIYFYVDTDKFELPAEEICDKHLDTEIEFKQEIL